MQRHIGWLALAAAVLAAPASAPRALFPGGLTAGGARANAEVPAVEAVFYNGTIHTMDASRSVVEAVAVGGGRIVALGTSERLLAACPPGAARVDLGGRSVIPGLTDAHAHFLSYAEKGAWADLRGTRSPEEAISRVSALGGGGEGGWALGRGWDQNDWAAAVYPGREEMDEAFQGPAYLVRVCGHAAWVNSEALRLAGIDAGSPDPPGGKIVRDAGGDPTGILLDNAMELVSKLIPPFDAAMRNRLIREAAERCLAAGLVGVHEMGIDPDAVSLYKELFAEGDFPFRITAYLEGSDPGLERLLEAGPTPREERERFSIVGVKLYADGSLGARSAALLDDYDDDPGNRGIMIADPETLSSRMLRCHDRGFQIAVHAIGDAAVRSTLDAYERLLSLRAVPDRRHRIEHVQIVSPADLPRFAALGIVPSMQFTHATSDMPWVRSRIGPVREAGAYAWRSIVDSTGRIPGGSDFPVELIDPLLGIYAAVTRMDLDGNPPGGWHPEQRLTVDEAVRAFTVDAAWAAHREDIAGDLSPGKLADFIVLSDDIFAAEPSAIPRIRVLATIIGGEIVHRSVDFQTH